MVSFCWLRSPPRGTIYAGRDGLATPDDIDSVRDLLPPQTDYVMIEGGNHAYFGYYGPQSGDNEATISRAEQQAQVRAATLDALERVRINEDVDQD